MRLDKLDQGLSSIRVHRIMESSEGKPGIVVAMARLAREGKRYGIGVDLVGWPVKRIVEGWCVKKRDKRVNAEERREGGETRKEGEVESEEEVEDEKEEEEEEAKEDEEGGLFESDRGKFGVEPREVGKGRGRVDFGMWK